MAFTAWLVWSVQAHNVPAALFESTTRMTVVTGDDATLFLPAPDVPDRPGFVFLPGGGIDWRAYVPFVRSVADAGYPAAIVKLPYRLAPTDASRAEVWDRVGAVRRTWGEHRAIVLAGHSRGAALAGHLADEHPSGFDGLLMIGTTHPRDQDLSDLSQPVVKVMGTEDCVADIDAARANASLLPPDTRWVEIAGANHAQFGHYGSQLNDCSATISREAQQGQARDAAVDLLQRVSALPGAHAAG